MKKYILVAALALFTLMGPAVRGADAQAFYRGGPTFLDRLVGNGGYGGYGGYPVYGGYNNYGYNPYRFGGYGYNPYRHCGWHRHCGYGWGGGWGGGYYHHHYW